MHYIIPFIIVLLTYLALSASVGIPNLISGLLIAAGIMSLLHPRRLLVNWKQLPFAFMALAIYIVTLIRQTVLNGISVARIIVHPDLPLQSGIVAIPAECESELGRALSAHAISLTPGELVVEMDQDGTMFIHSLNVSETEKHGLAEQKHRHGLMKKIFDG